MAALGLGLGDSLFNIQIFAAISNIFSTTESVAAFSVFQLLQNVGSAVGKKISIFFIFFTIFYHFFLIFFFVIFIYINFIIIFIFLLYFYYFFRFTYYLGYFYSPYLPVHGHSGTIDQIIILGALGWFGVLLFCLVSIKKQ